jgi:hypothetical protein
VLEIVLSNDTIAGAMRIPRERRVFFGDLLRGPANFDVRTVAFIASGKRIGTLAVIVVSVVVIVIVVAASAHTPVLLWPHQFLFIFQGYPCGARALPDPQYRSGDSAARRAVAHFPAFRFRVTPGHSPREAKASHTQKAVCVTGTESMTALPASSHPVAET